ncbi:MAG: Uma2 family endonuclease [Abitibacteriaceae bacterium]|nr:Uma2 family endonuclease [Abditibacteriaceae bacterium]MBV9863771.1 Uma2 family endonuclease [Abditibacteriaceae bacterium]
MTDKASLYASAGIPEYWIINLAANQIEVHRRPAPRPEQPFGFGYMDLSVHREPETITPLAKPDAAIAITDLLP